MAMEISNDYSNYASSYANAADNKKKTTESSTAREDAETSNTKKRRRQMNYPIFLKSIAITALYLLIILRE